jgi:FkbM family methyltransferase
MKNTIRELWKQHIAWRPTFYKRFLKTRRYLRNYQDILQTLGKTLPTRFDFRAGYTFNVRDGDTGVQTFDEIFIHDYYRLPSGQAAATIVDLGANIGLFSLYAHMRMPHATVFALEADPATFQVLAENLLMNSLETSIRPFQLAISSQTGKARFFCTHTSGWSSLYNVRGAEHGEPAEVDAIRLSSFCGDHCIDVIDFLKIDIEGAEYEAILGDRHIFDIPIREIVLEVDRNPRDHRYAFPDLLQCLRDHYHSVTLAYPGSEDYPLVRCTEPKT